MIKVSVIVPIYNSESTLPGCLGNLVFQTLKEIEIILIDDASTDGSLKIMNDCKMQFPDKVKVIHSNTNRGAGGARNIGLSEATGEYIGFVDSDDIVDVTMYEKMYQKATEGNFDIVDGGFLDVKNKKGILFTSDKETGDLDSEKRSRLISTGGYIWSKIFRASMLKDEEFVFRENCILEDSEWLMYAFVCAKRIGTVQEILYKYSFNEASLTIRKPTAKYYESCIHTIEAIDKKRQKVIEKEIVEAMEYSMIQLFSYALNVSIFLNEKKWISDLSKKYHEYIKIPLKDNVFAMNKIPELDRSILEKNL